MPRVLVCTVGFLPKLALAGLSPAVRRAVLITLDKDDRAEEHVYEAKALLEKKGLVVSIERCNIFDPDDCFRKLDEIIIRELKGSDGVDFNIGVGSPVLTTVGAMVASLHGQRVYGFAWRGDVSEDVSKLPPIELLPLPSLERVKEDQLVLLTYMASRPGRVSRGELKKFLERNCRPRVSMDPGADGRRPAANIRALIESLARDGYATWCPAPGGRRDDDELELVPFGRRMQRILAHRVPPDKINACQDQARGASPGRPKVIRS